MTLVCDWRKRRSLTPVVARDRMRHRHTIGLDIPCQVASPQSLTPLLQAFSEYEARSEQRNNNDTPTKERQVAISETSATRFQEDARPRLPALARETPM